MGRTLVIGYGNLDRADDGVAYFVIEALRRSLGQGALKEDDTGLEELGGEIDSVFLQQLTPDLLEVMADYDEVVFVDAHVDGKLDALHCASVVPEDAALAFTHHITPAMLMAWFQALYHRKPSARIVSIKGCDFDFHRGLSSFSAELVGPAVRLILKEDMTFRKSLKQCKVISKKEGNRWRTS
ncbi:MAG TPA: hydrogenase maturation protease [Syntrophales bacterium]|nr:hydrogenase maturation protease [Syntrophobacterales bacterium]HRR39899.1 hydrogenase maturation protease [Syntrophales bacterium]HRT27360.1 hydrogenase maturation protease [Syntrophales bacterium]HRT70095.1 hydrogenase maturation protease [Syntrophales bacterium]